MCRKVFFLLVFRRCPFGSQRVFSDFFHCLFLVSFCFVIFLFGLYDLQIYKNPGVISFGRHFFDWSWLAYIEPGGYFCPSFLVGLYFANLERPKRVLLWARLT